MNVAQAITLGMRDNKDRDLRLTGPIYTYWINWIVQNQTRAYKLARNPLTSPIGWRILES